MHTPLTPADCESPDPTDCMRCPDARCQWQGVCKFAPPSSVETAGSHGHGEDGSSVAYVTADQLRAAVADAVQAYKRDAERYRFIRDADVSDDRIPELGLFAMESLDSYIDAAMQEAAAIRATPDTEGKTT